MSTRASDVLRRLAAMAVLTVLLAPAAAAAADYHVGPGQPYTTLGSVPWYALQPGDTVYIHYQPTPYYEKVLISSRGTPSQWIRVLGVPGPNGELPIISGQNATTSSNMHYRWQDVSGSSAIQHLGLLQIAVTSGSTPPLPGYIEIANLRLQDARAGNLFTGENGQPGTYNGFASCIYARSVQHLIVRDNVLTNCGQGFYNWTGSGNNWWDGLAMDIVVRGNYFYDNGHDNSWTEHQVYTEAQGVIIEHNRFGPNRAAAKGSQIKDRSAGTVIRYNYIENATNDGWMIDLVEPENGFDVLGDLPTYRQAFIYGNVMVSRKNRATNFVHWNEDHEVGVGRATFPGARLFFYNNTVVTIANASEFTIFRLFNTTFGGFECAPTEAPGVIDVRNNIFASLPRTAGSPAPTIRFAHCADQKFNFGRNWVSPGWVLGTTSTVTGAGNLVSPANNTPGFVDVGANDFHLAAGASAAGLGGNLAPEVVGNSLGLDLTPTQQYLAHQQIEPRLSAGNGADAGAFGAVANGEPSKPANVRFASAP